MHRPAYIISWKPPNYPDQLNTSLNYSLSTQPPTTTSVPHTEVVIQYDSYAYLHTYVFDGGHQLSELSPFVLSKFNNSRCYKLGDSIVITYRASNNKYTQAMRLYIIVIVSIV